MTEVTVESDLAEAIVEADEPEKRGTHKRCAVCRTESPAYETLRFVRAPSGDLCFDPGRKAPGRGVSICAKQACVEKFRTGLPGVKALGDVKPLEAEFWRGFDVMLASDVLSKLGLLWRQRKLVIGAEPVHDATGISVVFVSNDAGSNAKDQVRNQPAVYSVPVSTEALGHALGKDRVAVVALGHDDVTKAMGLSARAVLWADRAALQGGNHG